MAEANGEHDHREAGKNWRWRYVFVAALVLGVVADAFVSGREPPAEANPEPSYRHEGLDDLARDIEREGTAIEEARRKAIAQNQRAAVAELRARVKTLQAALVREESSDRRDELRAKLATARRELAAAEAAMAGPTAEKPATLTP